MAKNIVLCSDGTGNRDIKARGTNVFKLYEAVDIQGHKSDPALTPQIAFYDDGVGSQKFLPVKLLGGAFGWGFARNVKELYKNLVLSYEANDRIFLFGFSRGAYTVRALSGLIWRCGILTRDQFATWADLDAAIDDCWVAFRGQSFKAPVRGAKAPAAACRARYAATAAAIHFIGVWDTVGAIGLPDELKKALFLFHPMEFKDNAPAPIILHARQALSIDDTRRTFNPVLWDERDYAASRIVGNGETPSIKQVWFPGVHANVGGGYPKQGISLVALDWMLDEAAACGLRIIKTDRDFIRDHLDAHDKLYDSRAGIAVYYAWRPRNIATLCSKAHVDVPLVHVSALERIARWSYGYTPGNIPCHAQIVSNPAPPGDGVWPDPAGLRAMTDVIRNSASSDGPGRSPLDAMVDVVRSGIASYYFFLVGSLLFLFTVLPWLFHEFSSGKLATSLILLLLLGGIARYWAWKVDIRMENAFKRHWQALRPQLLKLL